MVSIPLAKVTQRNRTLEQAVQAMPNLRTFLDRAKGAYDSSEQFELAKQRTVICANLGIIDLATAERKPQSPDRVGFETAILADLTEQKIDISNLHSPLTLRAIRFFRQLKDSELEINDGPSKENYLLHPSQILEEYKDVFIVFYVKMAELLSNSASAAAKTNQLICTDDLLWSNNTDLPSLGNASWWVPFIYISFASYLSNGLYNLLLNSMIGSLEPKRYNHTNNYLQEQRQLVEQTRDALEEIFERSQGIVEWKLRLKSAGSVAIKTKNRGLHQMRGRRLKSETRKIIDRFNDLVGGMIVADVSSSAELRAFSESFYRNVLIGDFRILPLLSRDTLDSETAVRSIVRRFKPLKPNRAKCEIQFFTPALMEDYYFGGRGYGLYRGIPNQSGYVTHSDILLTKAFLEQLDSSRRM